MVSVFRLTVLTVKAAVTCLVDHGDVSIDMVDVSIGGSLPGIFLGIRLGSFETNSDD